MTCNSIYKRINTISNHTVNIYSSQIQLVTKNAMFGWCQEIPLLEDRTQKALHRNKSSLNCTRNPLLPTSKSSRLPTSNIISLLNISKQKKRKGIKIHKQEIHNQRKNSQLHSLNSNQLSQYSIKLNSNHSSKLINCATQTSPAISRQPEYFSNPYSHITISHPISQFSSRDASPLPSRYHPMGDMRPRMITMPTTYEERIQLNKQTKSTNCHVQGDPSKIAMLHSRTIRDVESFHQKQKITDVQEHKPYFGQSTSLPLKKNEIQPYLPKKIQTEQKIVIFEDDCEMSPSFAPKRHKILEKDKYSFFQQRSQDDENNVENNRTIPARSQNKFKLTPQRRALLMDRDTIVSKSYYDPLQSQKSLRVQQSIIFQRQIKSEYVAVVPSTHSIETDAFHLYLAIEKKIGLMVSIKQLSKISSMVEISDELLIYKELQSHNVKLNGLLQLYQAQIDNNSYIFVKQPYDKSLAERLRQCKFKRIDIQTEINAIIADIRQTIQEASKLNLSLKRHIYIDDIVIGFGKHKIQSATIFEIDANEGLSEEGVIENLRREVQQFLL